MVLCLKRILGWVFGILWIGRGLIEGLGSGIEEDSVWVRDEVERGCVKRPGAPQGGCVSHGGSLGDTGVPIFRITQGYAQY